jgi:hypothetical protein
MGYHGQRWEVKRKYSKSRGLGTENKSNLDLLLGPFAAILSMACNREILFMLCSKMPGGL